MRKPNEIDISDTEAYFTAVLGAVTYTIGDKIG